MYMCMHMNIITIKSLATKLCDGDMHACELMKILNIKMYQKSKHLAT